MPKIKFSHLYKKILFERKTNCGSHPVEKAKLLQVIKVNTSDLTQHFLDYDTDGVFPIKKNTEYLMLIFLGYPVNVYDYHKLFTTLRTFNDQKLQYYSSLVGSDFEVELTQKEG